MTIQISRNLEMARAQLQRLRDQQSCGMSLKKAVRLGKASIVYEVQSDGTRERIVQPHC
jgi:hypothetical protein